jgi:hypothetical protein
MNVLFLDIDGVLNNLAMYKCPNTVWRSKQSDIIMDLGNMQCLKELVFMTGCKIVLSTSWRTLGNRIRYVFQEADLPPIEDATPVLGMNARAKEIQQYLLEHPEVDRYVILDDCDVFPGDMHNHLVLTNPMVGLTMEDVRQACAILHHLPAL